MAFFERLRFLYRSFFASFFPWLRPGEKRPQDIQEELQSHLALEERLLCEQGLTPQEAETRARQSFGNRTLIVEHTRAAWRSQPLDRLAQDLQYAGRTLLRNRTFTVVAVLSLALGIGSATAVLSLADTVFLRPLPYPHPEQLLWVANRFPGMAAEFLASPDYVAWRRDNHVFAQLAATQAHGGDTELLNGSAPTEVHVVSVSSNFLSTLGISPALGRDFTRDEELPNGPKAILISYRLWQHRFHGARNLPGQSIVLDGQSYTVAGVLPAAFAYPMDVPLDVMKTLPVSPTASHHDRNMSTWAVYGRLKPGVTIGQARADLARLFLMSTADIPLLFRSDTKLIVEPLQQHRVGDARVLLAILLGAAGCLLLIACANVSNLLLGRWSARAGEFAIRCAIGAGRGRLARQLFTEAALLTGLGCALGFAVTVAILRAFVHYAAGELPRLQEVSVDARVFLIGLLLAALTTLLFGTLPVLRAGRMDILSALQQSGRLGLAAGYRFAKRALVVVEIALSLILLAGASLLLESLWHLRNDHLGFAPESAFTVTIPIKGTKLDTRNRQPLIDDLVAFTRRLPGVEAAAQTECTPLSGGAMDLTFSRSDRPLPEAFHRGDGIHVCGTGVDYIKAAGLRLVRGRFFDNQDFAHPNTVALLNQTAARAYFPGEDALGKRILGGPQAEWKTVIGVVSDSKNRGLNAPPDAQAFINGVTWPESTELTLLVRSLSDRRSLETVIAQKLRSIDPGLLAKFETLNQTIGEMTAGPRFNGMLVASFAAIAFLMAVIGVYGVLTFVVTQRTPEIGIRMALGAAPGRMFALVLAEGATLVLLGMCAGFAGIFALTRYLKSLLYGVSATDPRTFVFVALALALAAAVAMALPARRAASVDPMIALRSN